MKIRRTTGDFTGPGCLCADLESQESIPGKLTVQPELTYKPQDFPANFAIGADFFR